MPELEIRGLTIGTGTPKVIVPIVGKTQQEILTDTHVFLMNINRDVALQVSCISCLIHATLLLDDWGMDFWVESCNYRYGLWRSSPSQMSIRRAAK